jgi:excisionase family DNA binding protein
MSDRRPLASIEDVSVYLGVSITTIRQWRVRREGPPGIKVGRYIRFRWEDVDAWLEDQPDRITH